MEGEWEVEKQSGGNNNNTKTGFIMRIGKKIVITGMVISSAPFFLPPLLVFSTVGFAFAVPFGLVFAGYACTEKVMSKLLSNPNNVETIQENRDDMEVMEEEFEEDVKKTLEVRIESTGNDESIRNGEIPIEETVEDEDERSAREVPEDDKSIRNGEIPIEETVSSVEEERSAQEVPEVEEDEGVIYVQEEEPLKSVVESENKEDEVLDETLKPVEVQDVAKEMVDSKEADEMVEDEKPVGTTTIDVKKAEAAKELKVITVIENAREIADESGLDLFDVVTATLEQDRTESDDEGISPDMVSYYISQSVEVNSLPEHIRSVELSSLDKDSSLDSVVYPPAMPTNLVTPSEEVSQARVAESVPQSVISELSSAKEDQTPEPLPSDTFKAKPASLVSETTPLKEVSQARVAESSPQSVISELSSAKEDYTPEPVSSDTFKAKPDGLVSETTPLKEALYSEEKMWDLVMSMRKIVGYKCEKQPNFTEELKALYIFTGVEPPAAFKDPLDLGEVNDKIRLLMGIIGVK